MEEFTYKGHVLKYEMTEDVAQFVQDHRDEILAMGDEAKKPATEENKE